MMKEMMIKRQKVYLENKQHHARTIEVIEDLLSIIFDLKKKNNLILSVGEITTICKAENYVKELKDE